MRPFSSVRSGSGRGFPVEWKTQAGKVMPDMAKLWILLCATVICGWIGAGHALAQTNASGRAIAVATPTPGPVGTASTALNSSATSSGAAAGQGSMGTGVKVPASSAVSPIVPGAVTINSNASSLGTSNVAGSVTINSGGAGTATGATTAVSSVPTYVTPGSGLGTAAGTGIAVPNPNPGSVQ